MTKPTTKQLNSSVDDYRDDIIDLAERGYSPRWIAGFIAGKHFSDCPSQSIPWASISSFIKEAGELVVNDSDIKKIESYNPKDALKRGDMPDPITIVNKVYKTMTALLDENADMGLTKEASVAAQQLLKTCEVILKVYDQSTGKSASGGNITINYMENLGVLEDTLKFLEKNGMIKILLPLDFTLIDVTNNDR